MNPTLVITDSRGRNLAPIIHGLTDREVTVAVYPGADIITSILKARSLLTSRDWSQVYILSGVCNLTIKDKKTKKISLQYTEPQQLLSHFQELLVSAFEKLSSINTSIPSNCKVIFAPITGIELAKYNKTVLEPHQETLNRCIEIINTEIATFNRIRNVFTPWTSRIIHHRSRGKYHTRYDKLTDDGCHLTPDVTDYWAQSLLEAIVKNT